MSTPSSNQKSKVPQNHFTLLYFATAASYTRKNSDIIPATNPTLTIPKLFALLEEKYPGINAKVLASCAVTVDLEYVDLDDAEREIGPGSEVAIIPPVSSG